VKSGRWQNYDSYARDYLVANLLSEELSMKLNIQFSRMIFGLARVSVFFIPVLLHAQIPDDSSRILRADQNGDGNIAWSELIAMRDEAFLRLDRNGDGTVNSEDRPGFGFGRRFDEAFNQLRTRFDRDGDQYVSHAELLDGPEPMFEEGDLNRDAVLSAEEIARLRLAHNADSDSRQTSTAE
jgi:hypothetical protein